ncbi:hypothetical protein AnigIFM63604_001859 [Aspergillus niger]|nr:short chain dehydrogenase family protein [Aspergillus niger]GLA47428.1 hypothetical protein AnigIFM63604_001859 [Aspergillus niger]
MEDRHPRPSRLPSPPSANHRTPGSDALAPTLGAKSASLASLGIMTHTTTAFRHVSQYEHRDLRRSDVIGAAAQWPQRKRQGVPERGDLASPEAKILRIGPPRMACIPGCLSGGLGVLLRGGLRATRWLNFKCSRRCPRRPAPIPPPVMDPIPSIPPSHATIPTNFPLLMLMLMLFGGCREDIVLYHHRRRATARRSSELRNLTDGGIMRQVSVDRWLDEQTHASCEDRLYAQESCVPRYPSFSRAGLGRTITPRRTQPA